MIIAVCNETELSESERRIQNPEFLVDDQKQSPEPSDVIRSVKVVHRKVVIRPRRLEHHPL